MFVIQLHNQSPIQILLGSNYESSQEHRWVSEVIAQVSLFTMIHVFCNKQESFGSVSFWGRNFPWMVCGPYWVDLEYCPNNSSSLLYRMLVSCQTPFKGFTVSPHYNLLQAESLGVETEWVTCPKPANKEAAELVFRVSNTVLDHLCLGRMVQLAHVSIWRAIC